MNKNERQNYKNAEKRYSDDPPDEPNISFSFRFHTLSNGFQTRFLTLFSGKSLSINR